MIGFVVQGWRTVRVAQATTTFVQPESEWLDLSGFEDVALWLDTKSVLAPGVGVTVDLSYETAPSRDNLQFRAMGTVSTMSAAPASNPVVTNVILERNPTVPLARWLRLKLAVAGTPTGRWGACFRVLATGNPIGRI